MNRAATVLAVFLTAATLSAQGPQPLAFEVASVRPSGPPVPFGRRSPDQWRAGRATLVRLIASAYPQFAFEQLVVGGPAWVREARFDVDARMDPATTPVQLAQMVGNLLSERFGLRTHIEQRPVDLYVLRRARDDGGLGPQMKRSDPSCVEAVTAQQPLPPSCRETATTGMQYRAMQISDFLRLLSLLGIDRPVFDRTELTGHFDIHIQYADSPFTAAAGRPPAGADGASFFTALQDQAGLKLEAVREVVDVLVIDSVEQPTPN